MDKKDALAEIVRLSEEMGLYEDDTTPEEVVELCRQVRHELAEERRGKREAISEE